MKPTASIFQPHQELQSLSYSSFCPSTSSHLYCFLIQLTPHYTLLQSLQFNILTCLSFYFTCPLHPNLVIDLLSSCLSQVMILVNITQPCVFMPLRPYGLQTRSCLFSVCPNYWLPFLCFYDKPHLLLMSILGGLIFWGSLGVHPAWLSVLSTLHEIGLI